ncbi:MAG: DUF3291 domain-containing protein [Roseibium sp.]
MTKAVLAAYTFNQFVAPYNSAAIKGFRDAEPGAFAAIERAYGFVARSGYDGEDGPESWGTQVFPKCWTDNGDGFAPSTLSLWENIEALIAATYHGPHGAAFRKGGDWHVPADHIPEYVLWWVSDTHIPEWGEAVARFESLMAEGPCPRAFSFKKAFDHNGAFIKPDTALVKSLAARNETASSLKSDV